MNFLTKAFVVLVTVLSLLLVALVVPFVANTENYKGQIDELNEKYQLAQSRASTVQAELANMQEKRSQEFTALNSTSQAQLKQITALTDDLKGLQAEIETRRAENIKLTGDLSRLASSNEQQSQISNALQAELKERRSDMQNQQVRMIQLADRNNELQSQIETLDRNLRRFKEQMTELQSENAEFENMLAKLPPEELARLRGTEEATKGMEYEPATTEPIRGVVTGIESMRGEMFVKVNVGRADGVAANMKFLVHRGQEFLGTLIITTVDDQESAGRVTLAQGEVLRGDGVFTGGTQ